MREIIAHKRIKELREEKGLSQLQLAKETGITQSNISRYEAGISIPTSPNLIILSEYFKVSIDYLLGLEDYY